MIEKDWEDNDDVKVFTYDAWTHQGYPLRRAFLEELISSLQTKNKEEDAGWLSKFKCGEPEHEKCIMCSKRKTECHPDIIRIAGFYFRSNN